MSPAVRSPKSRGLMHKMTYSCVGHLSMLRCNLSPATALIACGIFVVSSCAAFAQQSGGDQKPPEQAQGEQKSDDKTANDQKAAEQAAQQEAAKAIEEYKEAAAKLSSSAGAPECVWTGRRGDSLPWRRGIRHGS